MARRVTASDVRKARRAFKRSELDAKIEKIRAQEASADSEVKRRQLRAKRVEHEAERYRLRQRRSKRG